MGLATTVVAGSGILAILNVQSPAYAEEVNVYKDPNCGCCMAWVEHLRNSGFKVSVRDMTNLGRIKAEFGVPDQLQSCHTATVDGYIVEGHVPAVDIVRLLAERPKARGIAVPGMPIGSPGMEQEREQEAYDVLMFQDDGTSAIFARH